MITEIKTSSGEVTAKMTADKFVEIIYNGRIIAVTLAEAIELRDFLIQLNLGEK